MNTTSPRPASKVVSVKKKKVCFEDKTIDHMEVPCRSPAKSKAKTVIEKKMNSKNPSQ